jgi:uncharacterized repeat protein (TIGR01451 family)
MKSGGKEHGLTGSGIWVRLLALVLLIGAASPALAVNCSDPPYFGVIDGNVHPAPDQIQVDTICRVSNYPASNPLTTNFSFLTQPGQTDERWIIIFNNVYHIGQMACNAVANHRIWFVNGSSSTIQEGCQNLLIPVEKIDKQNPPGPATATHGVPFTYRLTMPVLFDPATQTVLNEFGSGDDLHGVRIEDDLNATGVDLSYVSHVAYWEDTGEPVPHTFSDVGGLLTFDGFPVFTAGRQVVIELTVVLEDTPANAVGTQFINTAKWEFGRLVDGVFYQPLPGEWGISPPLTIVAPQLVVDKTGPSTLNVGQWGDFAIDLRNAGTGDAWNTRIVDRLPDGAAAGMCSIAPEVTSVGVFAADGVTPVPGKGALAAGSDYAETFSPAPSCELRLELLGASGTIGAGERLIVRYRAQLDPDSQNGATLTNVAGATLWFNGDASNASRQGYARALTDGTVGIEDHEDAHTLVVALTGNFFEKSVANLRTGADPTATAVPGDTLRYTLRIRTTDEPLDDLRVFDEIDALNPESRFVPGTLALVEYPAGANVANTSATGGAAGTGVLDVRGFSVPAFSTAVIRFDVELRPVIANGTVVTNQSALRLADGTLVKLSDDPNAGGAANPELPEDGDPTRVTVASGPAFLVQKTSADLTADPAVLLAGETLRYTISVRNVGTDDATDALLRDQVPVNTTYVAGSTTLNGAPVADVAGRSPLVDGMAISSPADATPGAMPADASDTTANVATITFDVVVDPGTVEGTIISNQGFVSAVAGGVASQPSDDPDTPVADDPTRDIVGALPLLYAEKRVELAVDGMSPGLVDPGDVLRYTIAVYNNGSVPATGALLRDAVPAHTTYVADSSYLNGLPVRQPDGGVSPLVAGIDISSSDLTPPLPGAGEGTLSPGQSAVLVFELRVDDDTARGTVISNQAVVSTEERPDLLTDGDGNPATGPEPTVVIVGDAQRLAITKSVVVVGGGAALAGSTLEYTVRVSNPASVPAFYVVLRDDLAMASPGYLTYVDGSARLDGATAGVSVAGTVITADFSAVNGALPPGGSTELRFRAVINPDLAIGTTVTNTGVVTWGTPEQTAMASVSIAVGGVPGVGILGGAAWHDADFDDVQGGNERALAGWLVEVYLGDRRLATALTEADGRYLFSGLVPTDPATGAYYELRFRAPDAGARSAALGMADSPFTNYPQRIADIVVPSGANYRNLNLPIDPNGVVYDAMSRAPVAGATLTLLDAGSGTALPEACFDDPVQQGQVTLAAGWYKFDLNFSDPACGSGRDYLIGVTAPGSSYVAGYSDIIPPVSDATTAPLDVPACPGTANDAIAATTEHCEAQPSEFAPGAAVPARSPGTAYHVHLRLDDTRVPGSSQLFNNHIPLDPDLSGVLAISKTTPSLNVTRGQLVPYTITVTNTAGFALTDLRIVDRFPAGFAYVQGSARIDGVPLEPAAAGLELAWGGLSIPASSSASLQLLLAVGAGVSEGEYVNRAQAYNGVTGEAITGVATATVRVVPDPTLDCTDVTGKVFDDANRNGLQDPGERGLAGVRLVTARGLAAITDAHGRYHITCAATPYESRGSNFVLKLDDRTLPSGFRLAGDQVQVKRATRGKALRFNFGASIHRVVGMDLADAVFEPGTTDLRLQWRGRIDLLLKELEKAPAVLRLSYLADVEDTELVDRRMEALKSRIAEAWEARARYPLTIEPEVFWRLGGPPGKPDVPGQEGR